MATITIVGLGPGPVAQLTKEAEAALLGVEKIYFRTCAHPVSEWLRGKGKHCVSFDHLYTMPWKRSGEIYEFMVSALLKAARLYEHVVYAVPGSPAALETTTLMLQSRRGEDGLQVKVVQGLSFVEEALTLMNHDLGDGLQVVLPRMHLESGRFTTKLAMLVCQIEAKALPEDEPRVDLTIQWLLEAYPLDHLVTLVWTDGLPDYSTKTQTTRLKDLAHAYGTGKYFASLFVPPIHSA